MRSLKHATRGPHAAREGIVCGPRCFLWIFNFTFTVNHLVYSPVVLGQRVDKLISNERGETIYQFW